MERSRIVEAACQGLQATVLGQDSPLSPSIPVRRKRLELGFPRRRYTRARKARRWSRAKVKWEMPGQAIREVSTC